MAKILIIFAAINGAIATILAAIASHHPSLQGQPYLLEIFSKAHGQHTVHTLACLISAIVAYYSGQRSWLIVSSLFALGIVLFSYSLYLFAFTGAKLAGFLTPLGGVCFIFGWLGLTVAAWRLTPAVCEKDNE